MAEEHGEQMLNKSNPPTLEFEPRKRKSTYYGLALTEYDSRYGRISKEAVSQWERLRTFTASMCGVQWILRRLPVINLFRTYTFKKYVVGDIIAGLSVGVVTIPQSLGYAKLANVPVILGLYTSFFPVLIYFIFGSSRHVSIGTMALTSLFIAEAIGKLGLPDVPFSNTTADNDTSLSTSSFTPEDSAKISIAITMSFLAGVIQVVMSVCQLGCIVSYMAEPFISGYLAASNIRIVTVMIRDMLGIPPSGYVGAGEYFYTLYHIACNLPNANLIQILISVLSLATLILVKKCVNERFRSRLKVPIPIDIILVIIITLGSHYGQLADKFGVKILKVIPKGLPAITVPSIVSMPKLIFDSFILALINYMLIGMMAKLFCQRHNYPVDNNQELLATGLSSIGGSFFCCIAGSTSPPRCFLMEMTGGRTQIAYVIAALLALLAMLVIGPLFQSLPICVLSSIIFVACIPLFPHYIAWLGYWRTNKYDFAIWVVTAVVNLILGIDYGLLIGIGFSLVVVNFRLTQPGTSKLAVHEGDQICLDQKRYSNCSPNERVAIFRFESPIYFATLDIFKECLSRRTISLSFLKSQTGVEDAVNGSSLPEIVIKDTNMPLEDMDEKVQMFGVAVEDRSDHKLHESSSLDHEEKNIKVSYIRNDKVKRSTEVSDARKCLPSYLVVDCSAVSFLDTSGAKMLAALRGEYSSFDIKFVLAHCCNDVLEQLKRVKACRGLVAESIYPSIQDVLVVSEL